MTREATAEAEIEKAEKLGYDTGLTAAHPFDQNWRLKVMVANFVLMGYGTGAIFGCPGHDERDMEFARNAGMFPAGVLWGVRSEEELRANGARKLIAKPEELLELQATE